MLIGCMPLHYGSRGRVARAAMRGLSLVELMVGVALSLFIVAGAVLVVGFQLGANRALLLETQIQQDLRAAVDIMSRDIRRASYWSDAYRAVWDPALGAPAPNPWSNVTLTPAPTNAINYRYTRAVNQEGPFGFRLQGGVLQTRVSGAGWQDLTDIRTLTVSALSITPNIVSSTRLPCPKVCADGTTSCWPTLTVREYVISISGRATGDANVVRTLVSAVRVRNDRVDFNDPAVPPTRMCPT